MFCELGVVVGGGDVFVVVDGFVDVEIVLLVVILVVFFVYFIEGVVDFFVVVVVDGFVGVEFVEVGSVVGGGFVFVELGNGGWDGF